MIKLFRVDHRLLHGQVAFAWTNTIGANAILIANDRAATDDILMSTLRLAKPQGVKLVIKNVDESIEILNGNSTDNYNLMIIVDSVDDAYKISKKVKEVNSINLGGIKAREDTKQISKTINLTIEEEFKLKELVESGIEIEVRQVPTETKILYK